MCWSSATKSACATDSPRPRWKNRTQQTAKAKATASRIYRKRTFWEKTESQAQRWNSLCIGGCERPSDWRRLPPWNRSACDFLASLSYEGVVNLRRLFLLHVRDRRLSLVFLIPRRFAPVADSLGTFSQIIRLAMQSASWICLAGGSGS